jgi:plasmid stability protein
MALAAAAWLPSCSRQFQYHGRLAEAEIGELEACIVRGEDQRQVVELLSDRGFDIHPDPARHEIVARLDSDNRSRGALVFGTISVVVTLGSDGTVVSVAARERLTGP